MRIPGVGKKTAERMVLELRDKLDLDRVAGARGRRAAPKSSFSATEEDVISALMNFGAARAAAEAAVTKARSASGVERFRRAVPAGVEAGAITSVPRKLKTSCANRASFRRRCARRSGSLKPRCGPIRLADFAGQPKVKENLAIAIEAAKQRGEAMDHVLLYGPPGLGKTTLAGIIAAELGVGIQQTSGPVLQKKLDLVGILSNIQEREVFFIDEIHRLQPDVEEMIYSALEDFRMDILIGTGPGRAHRGDGHQALHRDRRDHAAGADQRAAARPLRPGAAAESLRSGGAGAASCTARRSCSKCRSTREGAEEIARRSRGTPRIANRLLRRVRDYAQVRAAGHVDLEVAQPRARSAGSGSASAWMRSTRRSC